jgi:hypothetical protein
VRTVLEHLEQSEGGDVDLLGGVEQRRVRRRLPHPGGAEDPLQPLHGSLPSARSGGESCEKDWWWLLWKERSRLG